METREIKLSIETATRWANGTDEELKALALQTYPELAKKQLPKSWEELRAIKGFFVNDESKILDTELYMLTTLENENIYATENLAKSHGKAAAKLSQVMAVYNGDWVADWGNLTSGKQCISYIDCEIQITTFVGIKQFLAFKDQKTAEEFFTNFKEDIEIYFNY
jgi:hypothetical protein